MIRKIGKEDRELYLRMADEFYHTDAVDHSLPQTHYEATFEELMRCEVYVTAYILEYQNQPAGYALLSRSFSQEAGGSVIWIEELYVAHHFRGCGLGREFLDFVVSGGAGAYKRLRLEVAPDNHRAISLYRQLGFNHLPYQQMILDHR
jgi:diamine N-acetyltransferase